MVLAQALASITESDLQRLIDNEVAETRTIEYKLALPGTRDAERKEFLADVSSFANANGGDLLYGVEAIRGVPRALRGLSSGSEDDDILRLESMIRDGITPRVPGVHTRAIPLGSGGNVIMIRVPRSWASPHMVAFQNASRFFSRDSRGKHQMDLNEIRTAFLLSDAISDKIRAFCSQRVTAIAAGEAPLPMPAGAKLVVHLVPFGTFDPAMRIDVSRLEGDKLPPIYAMGWSYRHNFDGYVTYSQRSDGMARSYVQVFRTSAIESVTTTLTDDETKLIGGLAYEREVIKALNLYTSLLEALSVAPPAAIMLSLLGVKGYRMGVNQRHYLDEPHAIDRDVLATPEVLLESFDADVGRAMRPTFDTVWNATGWPGSINYSEDGQWVGQR